MNKFGDFLESVVDEGMYLLVVGLFFVAAVIIFNSALWDARR
jgi:hypothetical protein